MIPSATTQRRNSLSDRIKGSITGKPSAVSRANHEVDIPEYKVYSHNDQLNDFSDYLSEEAMDLILKFKNFNLRMEIFIHSDQIYCLLKCPLNQLRSYASHINFLMLLDEKELEVYYF
jgi:hypothetical protein